MQPLEHFIKQLEETPEGNFFNPWYERDSAHDLSAASPKIRRRQLHNYFAERMESARFLAIAEALGYQGGHFSGIAMTSERILLGHHEKKNGIAAKHAFTGISPERTSNPEIQPKGFTEPTATIMWKALIQMGLDPYEIVLWNALAWHPYDVDKGLLSNRTPKDSELEAGFPVLRQFLELFPGRTLIAVGKKSAHCLTELGLDFVEVRHPANGGAPKFRRQMKALMG